MADGTGAREVVMKPDELNNALIKTDPAVVLVSANLVRRVIQAEFQVPYLLVRVPHDRCYFLERQTLFRYTDEDELGLASGRRLPERVILMARPTTEEFQSETGEEILLRYWRLLFHAYVHLELENKLRTHITPAELRARIDTIGHTQFQEIRTVLEQENYLLSREEMDVYIEFAAVYLDLRYFRSNLRATYFPGIRDFQPVDELLKNDLDADSLFARSRLPGAPNPVVRTDTRSDESQDYYWKLVRQAERSRRGGDRVRSAILLTRAARVAPGALTRRTQADARGDLEALVSNLLVALRDAPASASEWMRVLPALLDKADQGTWPAEAQLLEELRTVCVESERKLFTLDPFGWMFSRGQRDFRRPLIGVQWVKAIKHLRSATQLLTRARLADEDRQRLSHLLHDAIQRFECLLRDRFRPILADAFTDFGLVGNNPPEQVARLKMIEELLDHLTDYGYLSFSNVRDTISRNQLKLNDLSGIDCARGDALLRIDRRLAGQMEGVYLRGEIYLRYLEHFTSIAFGTPTGRYLTLNLALPLLSAFGLVTVAEHFVHEWLGKHATLFPMVSIPVTAGFFLALIHSATLRAALGRNLMALLDGARWFLVEILGRLPRVRAIRQIFAFAWYAARVALPCLVIWLWFPEVFDTFTQGLLVFASVNFLVLSPYGRLLSEGFQEGFSLLINRLRFKVLQGFFHVVLWFFTHLSEQVRYTLHVVEEWLRANESDSRLGIVLRAALGILWLPVEFVLRLGFLVAIEPNINPIKLVLSFMAAKVIYVFAPVLKDQLNEMLEPLVGVFWADPMAWTTIGLIMPGTCAFLIWEFQENWKLFRANRSKRLRPAVIGHHGETMMQLLEPGFHSGTIPKLQSRLRRADRAAYRTDNWRAARLIRHQLEEVANAIRGFFDREFLGLLRQSRSCEELPVQAGEVWLACNAVRLSCVHANYPKEPLWLIFEYRAGWLLGGLEQPGWLIHLTPERRDLMSLALGGLYKAAGVDFVREQLDALLSPHAARYEFTDRELWLWPDARQLAPLRFDLRQQDNPLVPMDANTNPTVTINADLLFFDRRAFDWEQWMQCWQDHETHAKSELLGEGVTLMNFRDPPP